MTRQNLQTLQIACGHGTLETLLTRFLKQASVRDPHDDQLLVEERVLADFGAKYKVLVHQTDLQPEIELRVSLPGWSNVDTEALAELRKIYGNAVVPAKQEKNERQQAGFDFSIRVHEAASMFDSPEGCASSLSKIRVQAAGAPISQALARLANDSNGTRNSEILHEIKGHPRCGTCHCMSTPEKAMVVFTVDFKDATERSLARLFLQQFAGVQKQVAQSPHIEFRRSNDPPKEILDLGIQGSSSTCSGFISFTFFPSHVKTTERKDKAVELMVNFFPYLDKHVKSTKTYMHIRMRSKKNDLLRELKERVSENQCVKKGSPLGRKNVPLTVPSGLNDSFLRMSHGRGKAAL